MRIGQRDTLIRIGVCKGQQQSKSAYIFGVFCPRQDAPVGLVPPHANTQAMSHHLQAVHQAVPAGRHTVLVLDRAD